MTAEKATNLRFSREYEALRQFYWQAEGGWEIKEMLDFRVLLALRQTLPLAEGHATNNLGPDISRWPTAFPGGPAG